MAEQLNVWLVCSITKWRRQIGLQRCILENQYSLRSWVTATCYKQLQAHICLVLKGRRGFPKWRHVWADGHCYELVFTWAPCRSGFLPGRGLRGSPATPSFMWCYRHLHTLEEESAGEWEDRFPLLRLSPPPQLEQSRLGSFWSLCQDHSPCQRPGPSTPMHPDLNSGSGPLGLVPILMQECTCQPWSTNAMLV